MRYIFFFFFLIASLHAVVCSPVTAPTKIYLEEIEEAYEDAEKNVYEAYKKKIPKLEKEIKAEELTFSRNMQKWKLMEAEILMIDKKINHLLVNIDGIETARSVK